MQIVTRASTILLLLLGGATVATAQKTPARVTLEPRSVITHAELVASQRSNLLDFVRLHRPEWLRTRGRTPAGASDIVVYVDGSRMGGRTALRSVTSAIVAEVRFLDRREATTRYGAGHGNGAVLVTTGAVRSHGVQGTAAGSTSG